MIKYGKTLNIIDLHLPHIAFYPRGHRSIVRSSAKRRKKSSSACRVGNGISFPERAAGHFKNALLPSLMPVIIGKPWRLAGSKEEEATGGKIVVMAAF